MGSKESVSKGMVQARLKHSAGDVLQIRISRWLSSLPPIRSSDHPVIAAAVLIGSIPVLAAIGELVAGQAVGWFVWGTAILYGVLTVVMILGAFEAWVQVIDLGPDIDDMLDEDDQRTISEWLDRALCWRPQVLALLFGIIFSTWVGIHLSEPLGKYADQGRFAYSVTIGWTGGIGALTVYWLWGAPALFYPLTRIGRPKLDWVAPLQTSAIQKASRLTVSSSRLSTLGMLLFTLPIALTLALATRQWSVWVLSISPAVFSLVTVLICSVIPQITLQDLVRRGKRQTLAAIRPHLPTPTETFEDPQAERIQTIELYRNLASSPVSMLDWKRLIEYLLLLLSAIVPVVIALSAT
jgi:hypothetical protein